MRENKEAKELHRMGVLGVSHECTTLCESNENPLQAYEAPKVEMIEVAVEGGFAMSGENGGGW